MAVLPLITITSDAELAAEPLPRTSFVVKYWLAVPPLMYNLTLSCPSEASVRSENLRTKSVHVEAMPEKVIEAAPPDPTVEEAISSKVFAILRASQVRTA